LRRARQSLEIEWMIVPASSPIVGQSIGEARIRQRTGASIVALMRSSETLSNPGPETVLKMDDIVGVLGTLSQREAFRTLIEEDGAIGSSDPFLELDDESRVLSSPSSTASETEREIFNRTQSLRN
jgi:hypothetical protein